MKTAWESLIEKSAVKSDQLIFEIFYVWSELCSAPLYITYTISKSCSSAPTPVSEMFLELCGGLWPERSRTELTFIANKIFKKYYYFGIICIKAISKPVVGIAGGYKEMWLTYQHQACNGGVKSSWKMKPVPSYGWWEYYWWLLILEVWPWRAQKEWFQMYSLFYTWVVWWVACTLE